MAGVAATKDFTWDQGSTFDVTLFWRDQNENPIDLAGYTSKMQLRVSFDSAEVVKELNTEASSPATRIILGEEPGSVHLIINATDMAAIPVGTYKYDLEMISGTGLDAYVRKLIKGKFKIVAEVTR